MGGARKRKKMKWGERKNVEFYKSEPGLILSFFHLQEVQLQTMGVQNAKVYKLCLRI